MSILRGGDECHVCLHSVENRGCSFEADGSPCASALFHAHDIALVPDEVQPEHAERARYSESFSGMTFDAAAADRDAISIVPTMAAACLIVESDGLAQRGFDPREDRQHETSRNRELPIYDAAVILLSCDTLTTTVISESAGPPGTFRRTILLKTINRGGKGSRVRLL
jgi:hypothetical protein